MARTADKVRSLIAEDSAFEDALSVVLSRAGHASPDEEATPDGGTQPHTVTWGDVSDDLTSGQWLRAAVGGCLLVGGCVTGPREHHRKRVLERAVLGDQRAHFVGCPRHCRPLRSGR